MLDALLAFLVLAIAAVATLKFNAALSLHSEVATQRSLAVRLAQSELETLRHAVVLAGSVDPSASAEPKTVSHALHNATYRVTATLTPDQRWHLSTVKVVVSWLDRQGHPQSVSLISALRHVAPELRAMIAMPRSVPP